MQRLRRWATTRRSPLYEATFTGGAFGVALGLRFAVDDLLPPGFPYLTFFPSVALTGFFAGTRAGIVMAVLCGAAAWMFFIGPPLDYQLAGPGLLALAFYVIVVGTDLTLMDLMRRALAKLDEAKVKSDQLAQQNTLMFHELQHRVSNNLQVVASILKMQQRTITDEGAKAALEAASGRLRIVSGIQRQLHNPKRQTADLAQLMATLLPEVLESAGLSGRVTLRTEGGPLVVSGDAATPAGLIVVELVSNALEHAQGAGALTIAVTLGVRDGMAEIVVADDGPGLPEGFAPEKSRSLGLRIALQFTEQLNGTLTFTSEDGARAVLRFPMEG